MTHRHSNMGNDMKLGLSLPQYGKFGDATRIAEFAGTAEKLGYRSFWVGDRLLTPLAPSDPYPNPDQQPYPAEFTRSLDPLVTLTAAATATTSARLGSSTLDAPWYNAALLGRALTSLDVLSNGRLDIGIGLGWMRDEYETANVDWTTRGRRLDDMLDLWHALWTTNPVEHRGPFFTMTRSTVDLRPAQQGGPPVFFGGASVPALRRVGRRGAGWLSVAGLPEPFEGFLWDTARRAAEEAGRNPELLRKIVRINPYSGTVSDEIAAQVHHTANSGTDEMFLDLTYTASTVDHALEIAEQVIRSV